MLRNYLTVALRAIRKSGLHSLITISSLTIGIAAAIAIFLFIRDEMNFDNFERSENIYRLNEVQSFEGTNTQHVALSMPGMGPALLEDYPTEIKMYTRFWNRNQSLIENGEEKFLVDRFVIADSTFLDVFSFPLKYGDRSTAMNKAQNILLMPHAAEALFGRSDETVLGEFVHVDEWDFEVTGIFEEDLSGSHLQFDVVVPMAIVLAQNNEFNNSWGSNFLNTYLVLEDRADISAMEADFPDFLQRHMDNPDITDFYKMYLQPLRDVHLSSMHVEHDYNNYRKFNGQYIDVFAVIAIVILIIAAVNFMNLSIARASFRWKEIGVRKSIGAVKKQLFTQFIIESVLLALLALVAALILLVVLVPLLNDLIGRQLSLLELFREPELLGWLLAGTLTLGLISGIYPAYYMASFAASSVIKGGKTGRSGGLFRNSLIVIQYTLAVALIIGTIVVSQQLNYMKDKDIGYDIEQIMLVSMEGEVNDKFGVLKDELLKSPYVSGVTASGQRLGNNLHQWGFKVRMDTAVQGITTSNVNVDYDFFEVYGIDILEGRGFSREFSTDKDMAFVVNQKLAEELGIDDVVGLEAGHGWYDNDSLGSIIGVSGNFNFNSLHFAVNTLVMVVHPDWGYDEMSIKVTGSDMQAALEDVRSRYESVIQDWPFEYSFLDEHFEDIYRSDQQMSSVVSLMAGLAIFIACLGLFGLAQLDSQRRTKEVGIRKVMGASEWQIMLLLARNFALLVLIAFVLAVPNAYYGLSSWLEGFAFRTDIHWWVFPLAGLLAILVAVLTISIHVYRSASSNPVESLRYE